MAGTWVCGSSKEEAAEVSLLTHNGMDDIDDGDDDDEEEEQGASSVNHTTSSLPYHTHL